MYGGGAIDIAGDIYYTDPKDYTAGGINTLKHFEEYYNTREASPFIKLFKTPYNPKSLIQSKSGRAVVLGERLDSASIYDINTVIKGINNRIAHINGHLSHSQIPSLTNSTMKVRREALIQIKADLEDAIVAKGIHVTPDTSTIAKPSDLHTGLRKNNKQLFDAILRTAYYLANPSAVTDISDIDHSAVFQGFDNILKMFKGDLGTIVSNIQANPKLSQSVKNANPVNYFKRMKLTDVIDASGAIADGMAIATDQITDTQMEEVMSERILDLLQVLNLQKYIDKKIITDLESLLRNKSAAPANVSKQFNILKARIQSGIQSDGVSDILNKINISLNPVYAFYKSVYDPVYSFIQDTMTPKMDTYPFNEMMRILDVCTTRYEKGKETYGIYKIPASPELIEWMVDIVNAPAYMVNEHYIKNLPNFVLKDFKGAPPGKFTKLSLPKITLYRKANLTIPKSTDLMTSVKLKDINKNQLVTDLTSYFKSGFIYAFVENKNDTSATFKAKTVTFDNKGIPIFTDTFADIGKLSTIPITDVLPGKRGSPINITLLALAILIIFKNKIDPVVDENPVAIPKALTAIEQSQLTTKIRSYMRGWNSTPPTMRTTHLFISKDEHDNLTDEFNSLNWTLEGEQYKLNLT